MNERNCLYEMSLDHSASMRSWRSAIEMDSFPADDSVEPCIGREVHDVQRLGQAKDQIPVKLKKQLRLDSFHSQIDILRRTGRVRAGTEQQYLAYLIASR